MVARTVPLLESLRKASLAIPKRFVQVDKFFLHLFYFFIKEHVINVDKDSALEKRPFIFILFSFIPDICRNMNLESLPSVFFTLALSCPQLLLASYTRIKQNPRKTEGIFGPLEISNFFLPLFVLYLEFFSDLYFLSFRGKQFFLRCLR